MITFVLWSVLAWGRPDAGPPARMAARANDLMSESGRSIVPSDFDPGPCWSGVLYKRGNSPEVHVKECSSERLAVHYAQRLARHWFDGSLGPTFSWWNEAGADTLERALLRQVKRSLGHEDLALVDAECDRSGITAESNVPVSVTAALVHLHFVLNQRPESAVELYRNSVSNADLLGELEKRFGPLSRCALVTDSDRDGLTDLEEELQGSDPLRWDSDGDGIWDGGPKSRRAMAPPGHSTCAVARRYTGLSRNWFNIDQIIDDRWAVSGTEYASFTSYAPDEKPGQGLFQRVVYPISVTALRGGLVWRRAIGTAASCVVSPEGSVWTTLTKYEYPAPSARVIHELAKRFSAEASRVAAASPDQVYFSLSSDMYEVSSFDLDLKVDMTGWTNDAGQANLEHAVALLVADNWLKAGAGERTDLNRERLARQLHQCEDPPLIVVHSATLTTETVTWKSPLELRRQEAARRRAVIP